MNEQQLLVESIVMGCAFIILCAGLHYCIYLNSKTKKVTPLWLFIEVGMMFLMLYSFADLVIFGTYFFAGEGRPTIWIEETMRLLQIPLSTAAASFLASAGLLLKNSPVKPI